MIDDDDFLGLLPDVLPLVIVIGPDDSFIVPSLIIAPEEPGKTVTPLGMESPEDAERIAREVRAAADQAIEDLLKGSTDAEEAR